jgi:hypothetical protein
LPTFADAGTLPDRRDGAARRLMETHYELYIKQNGRWILEGNFLSHQREEALDDAKQLIQQSHIESVKVIREKRNLDTGVNLETTIYDSESKKGQKTGRKNAAGENLQGDFDDHDNDDGDDDFGGGDDGYAGGFEIDDDDDDYKGISRGRKTRARQKIALSPEVVVLTKGLVIVTASLAFAAIVTWIVQSSGF